MVLKKPYAFLIKHFRIIHLFLLIPMFYLLIKTGNIVEFLADYVSNDYTLNFMDSLNSLASNYINIIMYVSVIAILTIFIAMSFLLQEKDKPTKFYNISIIYYIGIFFLITTSFNVFGMIEDDIMQNVFARIIRDLAYVVYYSEFIFIGLTLVRGIGFNIKKFNFESDLANLEIKSEDSEEFEFLVGKDLYKTKRTIRRFIRELTYYYKENKFIFTIIFIVAICILVTTVYMNREVYDKVYKEKESLSFGNINISVDDSFISELSSNGKVLKENKTYLVLQVTIKNRYREDKDFNYANFQLVVNKKKISPSISTANFFTDFGNPYNGTLIKGNSENSYILVYEMDKIDTIKNYSIVAFSNFDTEPGGLGAISKEINIKPTTLNNKVTSNNVNKGTNINLKSTNLKNTTGTIINYEITNYFEYTFNYCPTYGECYDSTRSISLAGTDINRYILLVLDYDLELDDKSPYMYSNKNYKSFFEDFMTIKYTINKKDYYYDVKLENPAIYSKKMVMKVPVNINMAEKIEAVITVRNISYNIKLK